MKIGYHIHPKMTGLRDWSADEEKHLIDHLVKTQPGAVLVLDDTDRARRIKAALPNTAVVLRNWFSEGGVTEGDVHLKWTTRQFYDRFARNAEGGLVLNAGNEPSGYEDLRRLADWYAQVMELFGRAGISLVLPNFGEGHPAETRLDELGALWTAFQRWTLHYYGVHEYGTWRGMLYNEAPHDYDVWPWRVGRFETFTVPYLTSKHLAVPKTIVTEWGVDSAHDGTNKRGWRDSFSESEYAAQLVAALEKVYNKPYYTGLCVFSYGNGGSGAEDWRSFDVSGALTFQHALEAYAAKVQQPPPVVTPPPVPPVVNRQFEINISVRFSAPDEATAKAVRDSLAITLKEVTGG